MNQLKRILIIKHALKYYIDKPDKDSSDLAIEKKLLEEFKLKEEHYREKHCRQQSWGG